MGNSRFDVHRRRRAGDVKVWVKTAGRCFYCGADAEVQDHVVPKRHGGDDSVANRVPACAACNGRKGARSVDEFRRVWEVDSPRAPRPFRFWAECHADSLAIVAEIANV